MKAIGIVVGLLAACGSSPKKASDAPDPTQGAVAATPQPPKSLHARLGGNEAITAVIHEFVGRAATDPRVKERFFNTDVPLLERQLVEFVCVAAGGGCTYTGRDMVTLHAGMEIVEDEWNAIVEALVGALDKFKVPAAEKGELLGAIGPLKDQIVSGPDKLKPIDQKQLDAATKVQATIKDKAAAELVGLAIAAGKRGQRSYAEQLFTRAELAVGAKPLAAAAAAFREGAPPRVTTELKKLPADTPAQPAVGTVEEPPPPVAKKIGSLTGTLKIGGKPPAGLGVIMLTPVKGGGKKRTPKQHVIEQRGRQFAPHVAAVAVGSTVSFPNFDPVFHNVFSISKPKSFDLGMYKNGETREMKFDKPGIVRLGCNLHASMSGYLIVVDAPHYVVVGTDGAFAFKALVPGKYKVRAWNEKAGEPAESEIEIKEGANEQALELTAAAPGLSPDKFGTPR